MDLNIIEELRENNITILKLEGELDVYTSPKLKEKIVTLINQYDRETRAELIDLKYQDIELRPLLD